MTYDQSLTSDYYVYLIIVLEYEANTFTISRSRRTFGWI
jgi:hypothetical protein